MKRKLLIFLVFVTTLLTVCGSSFAHHGSAAYASSVVVMKDATVTRFTWNNPHCIVTFDVKDEKGNVAHWAAEIGSPPAVTLLGWNRNSLQPGDMVTIYIWPAKSGRPVGRLNKVVFPDGKTLRDTQLGGGEGEGKKY
jgi:Family of unknown function (DUF6152)